MVFQLRQLRLMPYVALQNTGRRRHRGGGTAATAAAVPVAVACAVVPLAFLPDETGDWAAVRASCCVFGTGWVANRPRGCGIRPPNPDPDPDPDMDME